MSGDTTHTVKYEQPGVLSALTFNKVAQFAVGLVILIVVWRAFWAGWFSMFAFEQMDKTLPSDGMAGFGTPFGLLPFVIDAVCLVGIGGMAVIAMGRSLIGPVFAGLPEWIASWRAETAAQTAAVSGLRTKSGRELTIAEAIVAMQKQIAEIAAKTSHLEPPPEPEPPKSPEQIMLEKVEAMAAKLEAMEAKPATKTTTRAKSNG